MITRRLLAPKRGYHRFDFSIAADTRRDRLHRQRSGSVFEWAQEICSATRRRVGVEHDCHPSDAGRNLFEHRQPLAPKRGPLDVGEPRDVSTWPRKACHESGGNRIGNKYEHDRDCAGFPMQPGRHRCGAGEDHVGLQFDQLFREGPHPVNTAGGPTNLQPHGTAVRPTQLRKPLREVGEPASCLGIVFIERHQHADPAHPISLLRARHDRPRCCTAECSNKFPPCDVDCHLPRLRWD
jgi:hypothetical protein